MHYPAIMTLSSFVIFLIYTSQSCENIPKKQARKLQDAQAEKLTSLQAER